MFKLMFLIAALVAVSSGNTIKPVEAEEWIKEMHCCNGDTFDKTIFKKFAEYRHECYKKVLGIDALSFDIFNCEELREFREKTICLAECTMKKGGVTDDNGNIKRDDLVQHMKNVFTNTEWKVKATEAIVDKCIASLSKDTVEEGKCNPASTNIVHCIWKEYILTCPKELHNDGLKCTKIRQKLEKGDNNYLRTAQFLQLIRLLELEHGTVTVTKVVQE